MKEIILTKGKVALVDDEDYERANKYKWQFQAIKNSGKGYANRRVRFGVRKENKSKKIWLHKFILNITDKTLIDHEDGDGLNNQKSNLRICSFAQNAQNRTVQKHSSQFKGVSFYKARNQWSAYIKLNGKMKHLGYYSDETKAARVYDEAAMKNFGEFAKLNFPIEPSLF